MQGRKAVILFIDDEANILSSYRRLFIDEPYEMHFAENALEGLKVLRDRVPDVIICDLKMPEMDGAEFFRQAKAISPNSTRIMISAISDRDDVLRTIQDGLVWKYLLKPWDDVQLLSLVNEAAEARGSAESADVPGHSMNYEKKIFFLYPPDVFIGDVMVDLISNGYECYEVYDHEKIRGILEKNNDSLLFINIDKQIKNLDWMQFIPGIMQNPKTAGVQIGVLSYNTDEKLREQYFFRIGIQCGFIQLKAGLKKTLQTLLKVFEANEAKGRRRAVRVIIEKNNDALLNFKYANEIYKGRIIDLSSDAMACILENPPRFQIDDVIDNIQLKLKGVPVQTRGVVKIKKIQNGEYLFILIFTHPREEIRKKICRFINKSLNEKMQ